MKKWHGTTLWNGSGDQLVQLLVVLDGEHQVSWFHGVLLVVLGSVATEFHDFSTDVLVSSGGHDAGFGADLHAGGFLGRGFSGWPLEAGFGGLGDRLLSGDF